MTEADGDVTVYPDVERTPNIHVPPFVYFKPFEFDCHDGTPYPERWIPTRLTKLVRVLDKVRERYGEPLIVVSGYRSPAWNLRVGGADNSQHMHGVAADVKPRPSQGEYFEAKIGRLGRLVTDLYEAGEIPDLGGFGYYPSKWVHLDVRETVGGHLAKWQGHGIGSERT